MKRLALTAAILFIVLLTFSQNADNHYTGKLDELNSSIAKDAGNLTLYFARADIYDELNDFERANSDYKKVLDLYQRRPDAQYAGEYAKSCYRLADDYYFRKSKRDEALAYVNDGLKVLGNFKDLEILEAILLGVDASKQDLAAEKYQALSQKYPNDIRLNMYYAKFLEGASPLAAAALYEKVIAADPFNREALVSLGIIYNNEANRISSGVVTDTRQVYGYAEKAAIYFEKLYKLNPSDKEVANVLLMLYDELDEQEKAKSIPVPY